MTKRPFIPNIGTPGTGWRRLQDGATRFQIEKGSREWNSWMKFYRDNDHKTLWCICENTKQRHLVSGPCPFDDGARELRRIDLRKHDEAMEIWP